MMSKTEYISITIFNQRRKVVYENMVSGKNIRAAIVMANDIIQKQKQIFKKEIDKIIKERPSAPRYSGTWEWWIIILK